MELKEALSLIKKQHPDLKPLSGIEYTKCFEFSMATQKGELLGNGSTLSVDKKTKKVEWKSLFIKRNQGKPMAVYEDL